MATGDELRGLMRMWPHGVSILSVDVEGDRMGVTVSSLVSLSLEPPHLSIYHLTIEPNTWWSPRTFSVKGGTVRVTSGRRSCVHGSLSPQFFAAPATHVPFWHIMFGPHSSSERQGEQRLSRQT